MWDIFVFAFNAVMPIILLIVLGYALKRIGFLKQEFLKNGNAFVFKVCLPFLLFMNVYKINSIGDINWPVVVYSEVAILLFFILGAIFVKFFIRDPRQKGVILQCVFRSNYAIIGLSLALSLGGEKGQEIASLLSAFSIPTFNILAILALTIFVDKNEKQNLGAQLKNTLIKICKNPLIIGVVLGLIALGIRALIPVNVVDGNEVLAFSLKNQIPFLYKAINDISLIACPLALVILGGMFDFSAVKGMLKEIIIGTSLRVLIVPAIAIGVAILLSNTTSYFNFDATVYPAFIALFGSPVAVSSAIMAEQMDNDGELASQLVVWTSILSIVTIFGFVIVLRTMGLL